MPSVAGAESSGSQEPVTQSWPLSIWVAGTPEWATVCCLSEGMQVGSWKQKWSFTHTWCQSSVGSEWPKEAKCLPRCWVWRMMWAFCASSMFILLTDVSVIDFDDIVMSMSLANVFSQCVPSFLFSWQYLLRSRGGLFVVVLIWKLALQYFPCLWHCF